tara:strand:- start:32162 stop:33202 length:1041 start_codon:yes stop_codon:yes gene_type:complete
VKFLRSILYPVAILYGALVALRNLLYDKGFLKSTRFEIPVIVVGNLSVGGTGKSPQIEYLIRLLQDTYKIAVLSRGYKRESSGFIIADNTTSVKEIGDEPMQFFKKFKKVIVAVDADRVNGINNLRSLKNKPDIILLDDAFQHRKVAAGLNILLTPYTHLYVDDTMLPTGDLREQITGAKRAQIIVVTKCPDTLTENEQIHIENRLRPRANQTVFFSKIRYDEAVYGHSVLKVNDLSSYNILLVTGIANTQPLCDFLDSKQLRYQHLKYADHHAFTETELKTVFETYERISSDKKLLLTTEKDYVRTFDSSQENVYYLPIETAFITHQDNFNTLINNYVEQGSRNN